MIEVFSKIKKRNGKNGASERKYHYGSFVYDPVYRLQNKFWNAAPDTT